LLPDLASLGMFVVKEQRGKHYGSNMIRALIEFCLTKNITPVAGCFAKNEFSRNALSRAGMVSHARLLKVGFTDS
jgi:RimJ/RimL family protein N-acetyltransferase